MLSTGGVLVAAERARTQMMAAKVWVKRRMASWRDRPRMVAMQAPARRMTSGMRYVRLSSTRFLCGSTARVQGDSFDGGRRSERRGGIGSGLGDGFLAIEQAGDRGLEGIDDEG